MEPVSVVALAGRRIDAEGASDARFPLSAVPLVQTQLAAKLERRNARALVCSAACGADLIALDVAGKLGIRRRVVLPFGPDDFLKTSVADRPDDRWGPMFKALVAELAGTGDLLMLDKDPGAPGIAYAAATAAILEEAVRLAAEAPAARRLALTVWEGEARTGDDQTAAFRDLAILRGFAPLEVLTH